MHADFMSECSDFAERKFHLECGKIELDRQGADPILVSGPGHLAQTTAGGLEYLCYLDANSVHQMHKQRIGGRRHVGSILRDEDFLEIRAFPISGQKWVGRVTEPSIRSGLSGLGVAYGELYEIRRVSKQAWNLSRDFATLYLPKHIEFPKNATTQTTVFRYGKEASGRTSSRDSARMEAGEEEIHIHLIQGHTEIKCCVEKGGIPTGTPRAISEISLAASISAWQRRFV
jgi:hypothetical protein